MSKFHIFLASAALFGAALLDQAAQAQVPDPTTTSQATTEETSGWYVTAAPGVVFGYPLEVNAANPIPVVTPSPIPGGAPIVTNVPVNAAIDADAGFSISGAAGYRFDQTARAELEVGYSQNNVNNIEINGLPQAASGNLNSYQVFLNGYYDVPNNSNFTPYIGGGVGVATLSPDNVQATAPGLGTLALDGTGASFAFQLKAGVGYDFSDSASAFAGYRMYGLPGQTFQALGTDFNADTVLTHSVQVGARYEF